MRVSKSEFDRGRKVVRSEKISQSNSRCSCKLSVHLSAASKDVIIESGDTGERFMGNCVPADRSCVME